MKRDSGNKHSREHERAERSERPAELGRVEPHDDALEVVAPWLEPLSPEEIADVLACYEGMGEFREVVRVSERPYSAGSLVRTDRGQFFVKKRPSSWRTREDLEREHTLIRHLRGKGFPTPRVHANRADVSVTVMSGWLYEVFDRARGEDVYRRAHSWTPFRSLEHARSAGETLAKFHVAVKDSPVAAPRPVSPMTARFELARRPDLIDAIGELAERLPALGEYLEERPWQEEIASVYNPFHRSVTPLLARAEGWTTHGDWHGNNLFFHGDSVSDVIDFHLADYSFKMYDLAVALDRNAILWLEIQRGEEEAVRRDVIDAILRGYERVSPLSASERELLPALLPIHQLDLALTNIAYYDGIERDRARADWAFESYLLDHARYYHSDAGRRLLEFLRERLVGDGAIP